MNLRRGGRAAWLAPHEDGRTAATQRGAAAPARLRIAHPHGTDALERLAKAVAVGDQQRTAEHAAPALPLGDPMQLAPAVMVNLLGDIWFEADGCASREPDWGRLLGHGKAKLHLYGKRDARRRRKMGHVTCLGDTVDEALATARAIKRELGIPGADEP